MLVTRIALPRRTFLRGMSAAVALPLLDAMVPALSAMAQTAARPVRRLGYVYIPMGMNPAPWTPADEGRIAELSPSLASLSPFLNHLSVVTNLEVRNSAVAGGNHATAGSAFLSCARAKRTEGSDYELGVTVDQVAARQIGGGTPIPSLEIGTDLIAQVGNCDNGFACVYQNNLSWASATSPLPNEADPRMLFERLFGDGGTPAARRAALHRRASLLDVFVDDLARLKQRVGTPDRVRLDQYLDSARAIEREIERAEQAVADNATPDLDRPVGVPAVFADHAKLMFDLQILAFQADITRVVTFQLTREQSNRTYPEIGVSDPHHPTSHHGNNPEKLATIAKINTFHVSLFSDFLQRMKDTPDGDSSLLDHSLYLYGSGMGNPSLHDHEDLPIVVAGGAATGLKGGRHIRAEKGTPLANLHVTMLDRVGVHLDSFKDSTGRVEDLFESVL